MRVSQSFLLATVKDLPAEAELASHRLMLRAGLIRRVASGLYSWLPLGLKVLRKLENLIRKEMDQRGFSEVLLPAIQPAELWEETGRWQRFGPQMLKMQDRHQRAYCFGPTHEEVITDLARRELRSYKQLPCVFYQIQTKFRDEIRPRFGVMRAREFLMKDAYSFHQTSACLDTTYQQMYAAYTAILECLDLKFVAVQADMGAMGGDASCEFHVLSEAGEDTLAVCAKTGYAANRELVPAGLGSSRLKASGRTMTSVATPGQSSCDAVAGFLKRPLKTVLKTLVVLDAQQQPVQVLLRADHSLNEIKLAKLLSVDALHWASSEQIQAIFSACPGYIGPLTGEKKALQVLADHAVAEMVDMVCGANQTGYHCVDANFGRDFPEPQWVDIRNVEAGDPSPDGQGTLELCKGIEVGHVFKLGTHYTHQLEATFLNQQGVAQPMLMGCYGIGVSRLVAAVIEQLQDKKGIVWPAAMVPFQLAIVTLMYEKDAQVQQESDHMYQQLKNLGIEVLLDDRPTRLGSKLADMELVGMPYWILVAPRGLEQGQVEFYTRLEGKVASVALSEAVSFLSKICGV